MYKIGDRVIILNRREEGKIITIFHGRIYPYLIRHVQGSFNPEACYMDSELILATKIGKVLYV